MPMRSAYKNFVSYFLFIDATALIMGFTLNIKGFYDVNR